MTYFVYPQGTPSHTLPLSARSDAYPNPPYIPAGHTIGWRQNGIVTKAGITDNPFFLAINTSTPGDVTFNATDSGSVIDFVIDEATSPVFSLAVVLGNNLPTISAAGPLTDAYGRTSGTPTFAWAYADVDGDPQYSYRVKVGTFPGDDSYWNSGAILSTAAIATIPAANAMAAGTAYFWTIQVSDGEKTNPTDPDTTTNRVIVSASGTGIVNTPPVVSNVLVDGVSSGQIDDAAPFIAWSYSDIDGQPQQSFRIVVTDPSNGILWDSGTVPGSQTGVAYNFNNTGVELEVHQALTCTVYAWDTFVPSDASTSFTVIATPSILSTTVDNRINNLSVSDLYPWFNWTYSVLGNLPLSAFEIRVADNAANLGTDGFLGDVWNPGVRTTPEAYKVQFDDDKTAFNSGCEVPNTLQGNGVRYFYQVQIYDSYGVKSQWAVGFFQIETPPSATNVLVIPAAPYHSQDLQATYDFVSLSGNAESPNTQIRWYDNGVENVTVRNLKTVSSNLLVPGDAWQFTVRPNDGVAFSTVVYPSQKVTILNRPPSATALAILPGSPDAGDDLEAAFSTSDPDNDPVAVTIRWYRNSVEQVQLLNYSIIPSSATSVGDQWYFTVLPNDGYVDGLLATSPTVKILNTPPAITSLSVDGQILPSQVNSANPTIAWTYDDAASQPQQKFQAVIGMVPVRTQAHGTTVSNTSGKDIPCQRNNGIVSTASGGTVSAGNEIYDSGVVVSSAASLQYATPDFVPSFTMAQASFNMLNGYQLGPDATTILLRTGTPSGTATGKFAGQSGLYDLALTYVKEPGESSSYAISVNGSQVATFVSQPGSGTAIATLSSANVNSGSVITVTGASIANGGTAGFQQIEFVPVTQLEIDAGDFATLSGYLQDGTGGIKLAGLVGTASTPFNFPSGTYDIELDYQTETNGNPTLALAINGSTVLNFTYESGAAERSRFVAGVAVNNGDVIKLSGTRNNGAVARVKDIIFRPTQTVSMGAALVPGKKYYASVRVFDGIDWGDWATTAFIVAGQSWSSNVSNATGWTIEASFSVMPQLVGASGFSGASGASGASGTSGASGSSGSSDSSGSSGVSGTCDSDQFQGLRFYDGTSFGYLRLFQDNAQLVTGKALNFPLDGTVSHVYRLTGKGKNVQLFVDGQLALDGTGTLTRPTATKLIEFGDIAGRNQQIFSTWTLFRYSTTGAYPPNTAANYVMTESATFPGNSIGRLASYNGSLYASVDPADPTQSSSLYGFEEGVQGQNPSVVAITQAGISAMVIDPNRPTNVFGTTGKHIGTTSGLQYVLGGKLVPDFVTPFSSPPEQEGWQLESSCQGSCASLANGVLTIDTTGETNPAFLKYAQPLDGQAWPLSADNATGWTVEARVKIIADGSGGTFGANASEMASGKDATACGGTPTGAVPPDDGVYAPGIYLNDGTYQEFVELFQSGVRLKYAGIFAAKTLSNQFYTVRVVGKGTAIAVYAKGDNEKAFTTLIFAPNGLAVAAMPTSDQERPAIFVDGAGATHATWQQAGTGGNISVYYARLANQVLVSGGGLIGSANYNPNNTVIPARLGFGLPAASTTLDYASLPSNYVIAPMASFVTDGVQAGNYLYIGDDSKYSIKGVIDEVTLELNTADNLSSIGPSDWAVATSAMSWSIPLQVSQEASDSTSPRIAGDGSGNIWIAFDNNQGGNRQIWIATGTVSSQGASFSPPTQITTASGQESSNPDIVLMSNGSLFAAWESDANDTGTHIFGTTLSAQTLTATGTADLTPAAADARNPRVSESGGNICVAYEDDAATQGQFATWTLIGTSSPQVSFSNPVSISNSTGQCLNPSVVVGSTAIYVAWDDDALGKPEVWLARFDLPTSQWASYRLTSSCGASQRPSAVLDGFGLPAVTFESDRTREGLFELYLAKVSQVSGQTVIFNPVTGLVASGGRIESSGQDGLDAKIQTPATDSHWNAAFVDQAGNLAIVWEGTANGSDSSVYATSYDMFTTTVDNAAIGYFPLNDNKGTATVENRIATYNADGTLVAPDDGTAFNTANVYSVPAPLVGADLLNPVDERGFNLNQNGYGFSIDTATYLKTTGAIDMVVQPHWASSDLSNHVFCGNGPLNTTTPNTMSFGTEPAVPGNALAFRIVDGSGMVHETRVAGNPLALWNAEDSVHFRIAWDANAIGTSSINGVSFPTATTGFACGDQGAIFTTSNGGTSWTRQTTPTTYDLSSICFLDANTGFACGEAGTVLTTTNGGAAWNLVATQFNNDLTGIVFGTTSIGFVCGTGGLLAWSADGGNTWTQAATSPNAYLDFNGIGLSNDTVQTSVIAVGDGGQVYVSNDAGVTYYVASIPVATNWNAIAKGTATISGITPEPTYAVGDGGLVMTSVDNGVTWINVTPQWPGTPPQLLAVSFDSNLNVWVAGQNGTVAVCNNPTAPGGAWTFPTTQMTGSYNLLLVP